MHASALSTSAGLVLLATALWIAPFLAPPPSPLPPPASNASVCLAPPDDVILDPLELAIGPLPPSITLSVDHSPARATETHRMRQLIANEQRVWRVGSSGDGHDLPFYDGPVTRPGSLAEQIRDAELTQVHSTMPDTARLLGALAAHSSPSMTSVDAFAGFYESFALLMAPPRASLNLSDEFVGAQRLSARGFSLKRVDNGLLGHRGPATLSGDQVAQVCGTNATLDALLKAGAMFEVDLSELRSFRATDGRRQFTPAVVAHFCWDRDRDALVPLSIELLDSGLTYSRFDSPLDWAMAKVALNAAETTQQQLSHFVETHALSIPLRVELYRWLAAAHPVRVLLTRHFALDLALEDQAGVVLFNASTPLDRTFGLSAVDCVRFINAQLQAGHAVSRALHWGRDGDAPDLGPVQQDLRDRGLFGLPHRYAEYAQLHFEAIAAFTRAFVDAFYADDAAVGRDGELQAWVCASASVSHLRAAFPSRVASKQRLAELLARLVFLAAVKHHAMNGETTWETLAMPYSAPALWQPLPTDKQPGGAEEELLHYLQPADRFPDLVFLSAVFNRPREEQHSLFGAFGSLGADARLATAVDAYERALRGIDAQIAAQEDGQIWPYHLLRPARLPHNNWI